MYQSLPRLQQEKLGIFIGEKVFGFRGSGRKRLKRSLFLVFLWVFITERDYSLPISLFK